MSYEKGASSWLSALPFEEHGFALHKGAFSDALCFHYGWLPEGLPSKCVCGNGFNVDHAMNCSCINLGTLLQLFCLRCHDVTIEPVLQKLTGENPAVASLYRRFKQEKQRRYEQRICEVEMGSFTPLVFSTLGEWAMLLQLCIRELLPWFL